LTFQASAFAYPQNPYSVGVVQGQSSYGGFRSYQYGFDSAATKGKSEDEEDEDDESDEENDDDEWEKGTVSRPDCPEKKSAPLQLGGSTAPTLSGPSEQLQLEGMPKVEGGYKCDTCDLAFDRQWHLNLHKESHPDSQQYKCQECGKGYKLARSLRKHVKLGHEEHAARFPCPVEVCPKAYGEQKALNKHLRSKHPELPPEKPKRSGGLGCPVSGCLTFCSLQCNLNAHVISKHPEMAAQYVKAGRGNEN
jgi:hypothetical protein